MVRRAFYQYAAAVRPLVLLVDGHLPHIDVNTSKFCKENCILLYCLPSHCSHITHPLNVAPLRLVGRKQSCNTYLIIYLQISYEVYFWLCSRRHGLVKLSTIVNSFCCAGIWPFIPDVRESKISPAALYHDGDNTTDEATKKCQDPLHKPFHQHCSKPSKLAMKWGCNEWCNPDIQIS